MPSERKPGPRKYKIRHGDKTWTIDPEEQRINHGAVDENGIRTTSYLKDPGNPTDDAAMVARFRAKKSTEGLDYEVVDAGTEIHFKVKEEDYLAAEARRHDAAIRRSQPFKDKELAADGIDAKFEELQKMTPGEFANITG